jgi:hypothetical protein
MTPMQRYLWMLVKIRIPEGPRCDLLLQAADVRDRSLADNRSRAKIHLCPLRVVSGHTIARQDAPMSAVSQKQTSGGCAGMSAMYQKPTPPAQQTSSLFDHLVGTGKQRGRHQPSPLTTALCGRRIFQRNRASSKACPDRLNGNSQPTPRRCHDVDAARLRDRRYRWNPRRKCCRR